MYYTINLHDGHALVHTHDVANDPVGGRLTEPEPLVSDREAGYRLPDADAYAKRLAEEAEAWLQHARARSRMKDETLVRKALHALAFSLRHRAHDFAVPSKLTGTSKHQPALWALVRSQTENHVGLGTVLDVEEVLGEEVLVEEVAGGSSRGKRPRLIVSFDGVSLGEVPSKHVPWLRPLVPFGAALFLVRVTGRERDFTLGCNVVFGRVGSAVTALNHALGTDVGTAIDSDHGGDGYGGDGAAQASPEAAPTPAQRLPDHGGDGATNGLRLVSSGPFVAKPQAGSPASDASASDIVLYREIDGTAKATVGTRPLDHVRRHSHAFEWDSLGAGASDLAYSVLVALSDEETAERWHVAFKEDVVARVPRAGGVIRAAAVRAWLLAQRTDQR